MVDWIGARHDQAAAGPSELFGREPEIQQLRQFVGRITQGAGEALLLSGDPGVGKTSLLDQAAAILVDVLERRRPAVVFADYGI